MRRFTQSKARLKGAELEIGYQVNDNLNVSVFGDVVRGKLYNFAPIFGNNIYEERFVGYDEDCWYEPDEPEYEEVQTDRKCLGRSRHHRSTRPQCS